MDLSFTNEQTLLADSARRFVVERYPIERSRQAAASPSGIEPAVWREFADLGWLALAIPEENGGVGAGPLESALVCTALGRGLVVEPYIACAVTAAGALARVPPSACRTDLLAAIADGSRIVTLAHNERNAETPATAITLSAGKDSGGWRLRGRKTLVKAGPQADTLLVSACDERSESPATCLLFAVPSDAGLRMTAIETLDGRRASHIDFDNVHVDDAALLASGDDAASALAGANEDAIVASCADAVGCMEVLLDTTTDYVRTRVQFGRPLAANQVIRHRLADMACQLEEARAIALGAALCAPSSPRRSLATSAAKVKVGSAARFVAEQAVQLHGGMGVTEELNVGAFFKRLLAFEMSFGTERHHLQRTMALRDKAQGFLR